MSNTVRDALAELVAEIRGEGVTTPTLRKARAALAQAQPAAPAYVPLSDEEVEKLGHRECWRYAHSTDPAHSSTYKFNLTCLLDFAKSIESLVVARMRGEGK